MKHIATVALMLSLGVAGVYAQQKPVKMTFSGTLEPSTTNLQPGTNTDQVVVRVGHGRQPASEHSDWANPGVNFAT
jgi:hypothetical protein